MHISPNFKWKLCFSNVYCMKQLSTEHASRSLQALVTVAFHPPGISRKKATFTTVELLWSDNIRHIEKFVLYQVSLYLFIYSLMTCHGFHFGLAHQSWVSSVSLWALWRKMLSCCFSSLTWKSAERDSVETVIYVSSHDFHALDFTNPPPSMKLQQWNKDICFTAGLKSKLHMTLLALPEQMSETMHCVPFCRSLSLGPTWAFCCAVLT